jgi:hypothetical protein
MKQFRLLAFLLASIAMTEIISIDISFASQCTQNQLTKPEEVKKCLQNLDKRLEKIEPTSEILKDRKKLEDSIKDLKNKSFIDANSYWIIPLLLILNLATVGGLAYLVSEIEEIKKRNNSTNRNLDKKLDRPDRDPFFTKAELNNLSEKHQKLEFLISNIQKDISNSQKVIKNILATLAGISRDSNSISQNSVTSIKNLQSHNLLSDYYPSENTEPAYITDYNAHQKNFADAYKSVVIDRDPENYNLSRAGQTEDVILIEESRGNYWLFSHEGLTYVVPSQKLKIREDKLNEVKDLFDCKNYQESNYDNYKLIKPALVSQKFSGNWRLKEKGKLQFG